MAPSQVNKGPLADRVTTPDAINFLNVLAYGLFGSGKTTLAGTAQDHPMTSPILMLDVEGGTTTLRHRKDIDVIQVRSIGDVVDVHNTLRTDNDGFYKTVAIDSLSELHDLDMREIMRRRDPNADVAQIQEWGQARNHMRKIVRAYRDLPMNTIFTAQLDIDKDNITGAIQYSPSFSGKLKTELPGFIDIVGYLYTTIEEEEIIRTIQFGQTRRVMAKDRTGVLGGKLDSPTIPMMWDMIHPAK